MHPISGPRSFISGAQEKQCHTTAQRMDVSPCLTGHIGPSDAFLRVSDDGRSECCRRRLCLCVSTCLLLVCLPVVLDFGKPLFEYIHKRGRDYQRASRCSCSRKKKGQTRQFVTLPFATSPTKLGCGIYRLHRNDQTGSMISAVHCTRKLCVCFCRNTS